jgi:O-antigen/teichoic acid export membrane protein
LHSHQDLDRKVVRSSAWVAASYGARQGLTLVTMLVLVRLLEPRAFGLVALAGAVVHILVQLQGAGMWSALVHRREAIERAAGTAVLFLPVTGVLAYGACFAVAPLYASAMRAPELTEVLRWLALVVVIRALAAVPSAIIEREIDYRSRAKAEIAGALVQLIVAISLAVAGFGVWSLVAGVLVGAAVEAPLLWVLTPWRPSPRLASRRTLRELVGYGRPVAAARVLNIVNSTLDGVVVGRLLGTVAAGYYAIGFRLASFPNSVIGYVIGRAMFPVYSMAQHDLAACRRLYVQQLQRVALLVLPLSVALVVAAEPLVLTLLGEQYRALVTPVRILAVFGLVSSFLAPCSALWRGTGRPQLELRFALAHLVVFAPTLYVLTRAFGLNGAAASLTIAWVAVGVPALAVTCRLLGLEARDLGRALAPSLAPSALMAGSLLAVLSASGSASPAVTLVLVTATGVVVYLAATALFARSIVVPLWVHLRRTRA